MDRKKKNIKQKCFFLIPHSLHYQLILVCVWEVENDGAVPVNIFSVLFFQSKLVVATAEGSRGLPPSVLDHAGFLSSDLAQGFEFDFGYFG